MASFTRISYLLHNFFKSGSYTVTRVNRGLAVSENRNDGSQTDQNPECEGDTEMNKWLRIGGVLLAAGLLVTSLAGFALAQTAQGDANGVRDLVGVGSGPAWGFVDENGDGINDHYQSAPQFVDENGDGVCDLCGATNTTGVAYGRGYRWANGTATPGTYGRNLSDPAFVDENGDGVCDYYGEYSQQRMIGRGHWAAGR
jgi:hypothetical protein